MLKQAGCNAAYLCRPQLSSCALLAGPSQTGLLQSSITVAAPFSAVRTLATQTPADSQGSSNSSPKLWAGIAAALGLGYGIGSMLSGNSDSAMPKYAVALADRPQHGKINAISKEITSAVDKAPPAAISGMTKGATKVDAGRVHSGEEPPHHGGAGPTTGPSSAEVDHNWPTVWGPHAGMPHITKDAKKAPLKHNLADLPVVPAPKATAPAMPPPVNRDHPVHMILDITTSTLTANVSPTHKYTWWTFDGTVPGPIVRCRVGDVLEVRYANKDADGIGHNIDFHAVTGPGGGAGVTYAEAGEVKTALFKMLDPGLFIYHCAAAPLPTHVANGMYGLVLVEPEEGLPPVDKEFYVMQSEVYAQESETPGLLDHNYFDGLSEKPMYVVFNGAEGSLTEKPLMVDQDDRVRIFFGNAGPNLVSALHLIGITFEKVYREGDLISPPARSVQTTLVPPGGSAVVEFTAHVPGNYSLVDHALFRVDKGAVGFLKVKPKGSDRRADIFDSVDPPSPCPGCKLHN